MRTQLGISPEQREQAEQLIQAGLMDEYVKFAEKQAPGWREAHAALACLAVGHAIRDRIIPLAGHPRVFLLLTAPTRAGKTYITKLAEHSIFPDEWYLDIATATPEGLAELLSNTEEPPILVIDEIGLSLAADYSRIEHFLLRAYNGDPWRHIVRGQPIYVPKHRMHVSVIGMSVPQTLIQLRPNMPVYMYAISGLLSRFLVMTGRLTKQPLYMEPDPRFRAAIKTIAETPLSHKFTISNTAIQEITNMARNLEQRYADTDMASNIVKGIHEHIARLAACHAASRLEDHIDEEDADYAITIIEDNIDHAMEIIEDIEIVDQKTATIHKKATRLIAILAKVKKPVTARYLYRKLKVSADEFRRHILPTARSWNENIRVFPDGRTDIICSQYRTKLCEQCKYKHVCWHTVTR